MPSKALLKLQKNTLVDVDRIISSHAQLNHDGGGKRGLGHITRSGVLMLCAAWELYVEEVGLEIAHHLADRALEPGDLPDKVQKSIAKYVRNHKHDLKPLELANAGWGHVYLSYAQERISSLNTPKSGPVDEIYEHILGWENASNSWACGTKTINEFVKMRGEIAHRGRDSHYMNIIELKKYRKIIFEAAVGHDNGAADFLRDVSVGGLPWRGRAVPQ